MLSSFLSTWDLVMRGWPRMWSSTQSSSELQTLERVAADWSDASAAQIEAATHSEAPWASTEDGKVIDYELAEYRRPIRRFYGDTADQPGSGRTSKPE